MSIVGASLPDALCQVLRANSATITAFGDTYNSSLTIAQNQTAGNVSKFWSDYADQVPEPYLVFEEVGETYEFTMRTAALATVNFTCTGSTICRIVNSGRATARSLSILVCNALNDCDTQGVTWPGFHATPATCTLGMFRMGQASFVPDPNVGPGSPAAFNRVILFNYWYQGQM